MQRRGFLRLLGAAVAAPMMPAVGAASGYTRSSYELAIAHAQKYPLVSVSGMAKRVGITPAQADAIIKKMSSEGLLGVLNPTRPGTVRASSKIFTKDAWGVVRTSQPRPVQAKPVKRSKPSVAFDTDVSAMFAHLHNLCLSRGITLAPRCFSGVHA